MGISSGRDSPGSPQTRSPLIASVAGSTITCRERPGTTLPVPGSLTWYQATKTSRSDTGSISILGLPYCGSAFSRATTCCTVSARSGSVTDSEATSSSGLSAASISWRHDSTVPVSPSSTNSKPSHRPIYRWSLTSRTRRRPVTMVRNDGAASR